MSTSQLPHSADYFGLERDFWWNQDFLALTARRCRLEDTGSVLDVGCGVGHWSRALLPHLPPAARISGIDPESEWIAEATRRAACAGLSQRLSFRLGTAEEIPFSDGAFDLVTCQTVLIHVRDCSAALREMLRVLRPGGRLLVAEPNNLASALVFGSTTFHAPIEEKLALVRFQAICERGKEQLGEGNNSIGDLLPGLFAENGLDDISVHLSDRATPLLPPYADAAQRAVVAQALEFAERDLWIWGREETLRYFLAGGGAPDAFEASWQQAMAATRALADALRRRAYHSAGGGITYVICGVKP